MTLVPIEGQVTCWPRAASCTAAANECWKTELTARSTILVFNTLIGLTSIQSRKSETAWPLPVDPHEFRSAQLQPSPPAKAGRKDTGADNATLVGTRRDAHVAACLGPALSSRTGQSSLVPDEKGDRIDRCLPNLVRKRKLTIRRRANEACPRSPPHCHSSPRTTATWRKGSVQTINMRH